MLLKLFIKAKFKYEILVSNFIHGKIWSLAEQIRKRYIIYYLLSYCAFLYFFAKYFSVFIGVVALKPRLKLNK